MKKLTLTPKGKKIAVLAGTLVFCGVLTVVLLGVNSNIKTDPGAAGSEASSEVNASLTVGSISSTVVSGAGENAAAFDPKTETSRSAALTSTPSKPTSAPPAPKVEGAGGTDSKGNQTKATNPALTNKDKTPEYTSKPVIDGKSKSKSGNTSSKKSSQKSTQPKTGDVKDGKTYIEGFGWVDGTGKGGGEGTTVGKDGDQLGETVGIMD